MNVTTIDPDERTTHDAHDAIENLVSLDVYLDSTTLPRRTMQAVSVFYGLVLFIAIAGAAFATGAASLRSLLIAIPASLINGLLFFLLFRWSIRWLLRRVAKAIYRGDGPYRADPPAEGAYLAKIPASLRTTQSRSAGGMLYLRPCALAFAPHGRNLAKDRAMVEAEGIDADRVSLAPQTLTTLQRFLVGEAPPCVEIPTTSATLRFVVPDPDHSLRAIQRALAAERDAVSR